MFPVADVIPSRTRPYVTIALISLNTLAFIGELLLGDRLPRVVFELGLVPAFFSWPDLLSSMFLHAGWLHFLGNMLYLWIFGDNIERAMGTARFLVFYFACGIVAGLAHIAFSAGSTIPSVGASGAISGVLGGYLLLFPNNRVRVLTRGGIASVPALVVLGFWIVIQLVSQIGSIAQTSEGGGVAYMAHIGGFVAGLVLVKLFTARRLATA
jgi:membrane associated rhomboid family serine protease